MLRFQRIRNHISEVETGKGQIAISLLGHLEEVEHDSVIWDVICVMPLSIRRRTPGVRYRVATPVWIITIG